MLRQALQTGYCLKCAADSATSFWKILQEILLEEDDDESVEEVSETED